MCCCRVRGRVGRGWGWERVAVWRLLVRSGGLEMDGSELETRDCLDVGRRDLKSDNSFGVEVKLDG